uniref:Pecanex-like protein n=1 Tax=Caenorhabditis japonica TaxID=281687 RepID=A0A8R1HZE9_CAEJA
MSVGTHIAEVIRQGIWASLAGGWYYEPSFSIFCNTLHLYVWFVLMVLPLVIGFVVSSSGVSITIAAAYTAFVVFFFTVIKLLVAYLHMVFDTTDPIVVTRTINDSIDDMYRESEQQVAGEVEMIELRDMGYNLRGSERALDSARNREQQREERDFMAVVSRRPYADSIRDRESASTPIPPISSKFWDFGGFFFFFFNAKLSQNICKTYYLFAKK